MPLGLRVQVEGQEMLELCVVLALAAQFDVAPPPPSELVGPPQPGQVFPADPLGRDIFGAFPAPRVPPTVPTLYIANDCEYPIDFFYKPHNDNQLKGSWPGRRLNQGEFLPAELKAEDKFDVILRQRLASGQWRQFALTDADLRKLAQNVKGPHVENLAFEYQKEW